VVNGVKARVITVVWVKKRQHVNAVEVSQSARQQLLDLSKVSADSLGVNQDAGSGHSDLHYFCTY
jgi:hypothetical protein